jgi:hypothetical protein
MRDDERMRRRVCQESHDMELSDAMDRVEELQKMNYDMLDYLRIQIAWLLEYCEHTTGDIEKAKLFFGNSGKILEKYSPTESQTTE